VAAVRQSATTEGEASMLRGGIWPVIVGLAVAAAIVPLGGAQSSPASEVASLPAALAATTDRWNAGDLEGFIAPYAAHTTFMTPAGPIDREAMRQRYLGRYFTGSRPDQQLRFEQLQVRPLDAGHALLTGRFVLTGGGKPEQSGWFTLIWARTADGWRIIHDHSS
jgi:ketosteroid isomerase-like protein